MKFLNSEKIEAIKTAYLNYGPEFWTWKKCNACRKQFSLQNHSQKQIELFFCKKSKINEYRGSEGEEVKWYHKSCLANWANIVEEISTKILKDNPN